jgi:hypothetical protein
VIVKLYGTIGVFALLLLVDYLLADWVGPLLAGVVLALAFAWIVYRSGWWPQDNPKDRIDGENTW